jgi:AcrR family transcriptional regulator
MDPTPNRKQLSHERIVDAAARAIRRHGYAGVGVADVMKDAGLTHGGFYAHFASRDALLVEAIERAGRGSAATIERNAEASTATGASPFRALVENYLADRLLKAVDAGCPVAALCSEMPRQAPDVRKASSRRVRSLVQYVGRCLSPQVPPDQAGVIAATLVGSLQIARAIGSVEQGKALLAASRRALIAQYDLD